jgi:hypothetical protein
LPLLSQAPHSCVRAPSIDPANWAGKDITKF